MWKGVYSDMSGRSAVKIKRSQAEWYCQRLHKVMYAAPHALSMDGNWLCDCGRFIKDDLLNHRIIRQSERTRTEAEKKPRLKQSFGDKIKKQYKVIYYTGKHPNECEHEKIISIEDYLGIDTAILNKIENSYIGLLIYIIFSNKGKMIYASP
jgi:hypothetical protein